MMDLERLGSLLAFTAFTSFFLVLHMVQPVGGIELAASGAFGPWHASTACGIQLDTGRNVATGASDLV